MSKITFLLFTVKRRLFSNERLLLNWIKEPIFPKEEGPIKRGDSIFWGGALSFPERIFSYS